MLRRKPYTNNEWYPRHEPSEIAAHYSLPDATVTIIAFRYVDEDGPSIGESLY